MLRGAGRVFDVSLYSRSCIEEDESVREIHAGSNFYILICVPYMHDIQASVQPSFAMSLNDALFSDAPQSARFAASTPFHSPNYFCFNFLPVNKSVHPLFFCVFPSAPRVLPLITKLWTYSIWYGIIDEDVITVATQLESRLISHTLSAPLPLPLYRSRPCSSSSPGIFYITERFSR